MNVDDAEICQEKEKGKGWGGEKKSIETRQITGRLGEGWANAWGGEREVGHEQKRNKESSAKDWFCPFIVAIAIEHPY